MDQYLTWMIVIFDLRQEDDGVCRGVPEISGDVWGFSPVICHLH